MSILQMFFCFVGIHSMRHRITGEKAYPVICKCRRCDLMFNETFDSGGISHSRHRRPKPYE
jgi:hypothetical protein